MAHPLDKVVQHIRSVAASQGATDGELLHSFVTSDDQAAFTALAKRHGPLVLAVCRRILGNMEDAEDAFQATFVVLARNAAKVPHRCSLSSWLHGVAYRIALNARRLSARRRRHERQAKTMVSTNPAWDAAWQEVQLLLDEEVQRLPEKYREPFILCCLESQSYAAAARRMGVHEGTVRNRLAEARKRLQARLARRGVELTALLGAGALAPSAATAQVAPALVAKAVSAATSAAMPASVMALVKGLMVSLAIKKAKIGMALFVIFSAMVGTTSMWALQQQPGGQEKALVAQAVGKQEPAVEAEPAVNKDIYGDPLPPGAVARLGSVRYRYTGGLRGLVFSADGKRFATAGLDGVRVWESETGRPLAALGETASTATRPLGDDPRRRIALFGETASAATFMDGGKRIAAAGHNLAVWDIDNAKQLSFVPLNVTEPEPSAFSPDGKLWAGVIGKRSFSLLEVATGKLMRPLVGHEDPLGDQGKPDASPQISGVAFAPNGRLLASACFRDPRVLLWETATGKVLHALPGHNWPSAIAFSADSRILATGGKDRVIRVWDTATGVKLRELRGLGWEILGLAFAPDGSNLASASSGSSSGGPVSVDVKTFNAGGPVTVFGTMHLWDLETGKSRMLNGLENGASHIAFSPDGATVAASGLDSTVHLINVAKGKETETQPGHQGGIFCIALSADGKTLASGGRDNVIHVWDLKTSREKCQLIGHEFHVSGLAFVSDGRELASCSYDGSVRVWDWQGGQEIRRFAQGSSWHNRFHVAPDGKTVLVRDGELWDLATGKQTGVVPGKQAGVFSPDGEKIGIIGTEARIVDVKTGKEICQFYGHEPVSNDPAPVNTGVYINCLAFSPDGRLAASGGSESLAFIWHTANGKMYRRLQGHANEVITIAFSPDGRTVATGTGTFRLHGTHKEQTVRLWEVATGKERRRFEGHQAQVMLIVYSRDGNTIISGSEDGTVLVWDLIGVSNARQVKAENAAALWQALRSDDAARVYDAMCMLAARRDVTVMAKALRPVPAPDAAKVSQLVAALGSDRFDTRQDAERRLIELEELAAPELRKAVAANRPLEQRRRLELLLARVETSVPSAGKLQTLRAIEVLERIGSPDARSVLETLAKGAPGTCETEEAKASLERLARRGGRVP